MYKNTLYKSEKNTHKKKQQQTNNVQTINSSVNIEKVKYKIFLSTKTHHTS